MNKGYTTRHRSLQKTRLTTCLAKWYGIGGFRSAWDENRAGFRLAWSQALHARGRWEAFRTRWDTCDAIIAGWLWCACHRFATHFMFGLQTAAYPLCFERPIGVLEIP